MQKLRRLTQGLFLLFFFFLFIQTESRGADSLGYPVRLFLDFAPLIFITTILFAHAAAKAFYFSLITIVITLAFSRVFCGWAAVHYVRGSLSYAEEGHLDRTSPGERPSGEERASPAAACGPRLCIDCGICENKCPVLGRPAISVSSVGKSRSKENQLLLT